jgi:hypothetical protein
LLAGWLARWEAEAAKEARKRKQRKQTGEANVELRRVA